MIRFLGLMALIGTFSGVGVVAQSEESSTTSGESQELREVLDADGSLRSISTFLDGVKHGKERYFYLTGEL